MDDIVVGVHYRLPRQRDKVDEAFYRQLKEALRSQTQILMGNFNHSDTC